MGDNQKCKIIRRTLTLASIMIASISCDSKSENAEIIIANNVSAQVVGAMKNVMWKGKLAGMISGETIKEKKGLCALGPVEYLSRDLLIIDGRSYLSKVISDSSMAVQESFQVNAPFLVYANQLDWNIEDFASELRTIQSLEEFIERASVDFERPFVFKLIGLVAQVEIHIQNLPKGRKVSSPEEVHQGQTNFTIENSELEIVGFFSTDYKGIFTHHASNVPLHLITEDS
jgi:acetolactate decarboxylase